MNKIVREHYPVDRLPEDLKVGLDPTQEVRIVIEQDQPSRPVPTLTELLELRSQFKPAADDPVDRIRKLRDEWND